MNATVTAKMITEALALNVAFDAARAAARILGITGKHDILTRGGQAIARTDLRKLAKDATTGITYVGRNSAREKCVACSPLVAGVNWERFSFEAAGLNQEVWVCECGRCYPSGKGKKGFAAMKAATPAA